ncbi:MAG: N-acetylneuraminate synthase family protein, partial [Gammaproteobacteria bacterium]|nr:N-acetylneuraminate synthase family protein [Gammaproteobacteria bacterium]
IMSTGMADIDEIRAAVDILFAGGCRHELTILQCTTSYPCPYEDVNLGVIPMLQQLFGLPVGISDHSIGIEVPIAAVALGAVVVEKHFTMDRCDPGPDHKASIEFDDMVRMVKSIRNIEMAMGDGIKRPTTAELLSRDNIRACQNVI